MFCVVGGFVGGWGLCIIQLYQHPPRTNTPYIYSVVQTEYTYTLRKRSPYTVWGRDIRRNTITNQNMPLSQILGFGTKLEVFLEGVSAFDGGGGEGG